jgi:hypothetical protein
MKAFIDDWCVVADSATVPVEILWKAHRQWAEENGNRSYSKRKFIIEIKGACNGVRRERQRLDLSRMDRVYKWANTLDDNRASVLMGTLPRYTPIVNYLTHALSPVWRVDPNRKKISV